MRIKSAGLFADKDGNPLDEKSLKLSLKLGKRRYVSDGEKQFVQQAASASLITMLSGIGICVALSLALYSTQS